MKRIIPWSVTLNFESLYPQPFHFKTSDLRNNIFNIQTQLVVGMHYSIYLFFGMTLLSLVSTSELLRVLLDSFSSMEKCQMFAKLWSLDNLIIQILENFRSSKNCLNFTNILLIFSFKYF